MKNGHKRWDPDHMSYHAELVRHWTDERRHQELSRVHHYVNNASAEGIKGSARCRPDWKFSAVMERTTQAARDLIEFNPSNAEFCVDELSVLVRSFRPYRFKNAIQKIKPEHTIWSFGVCMQTTNS